MSDLPSFEAVEFDAVDEAAPPRSANPPTPTPEGIDIAQVYSADDLREVRHLGGMPGFAPYVRGPYPSMYLGRPWTLRQYAGFST
ncbi:MAG: methylmalonyl-CoA mutase family protein, partial [Planctomycetota bacterium]